MKINLISYQHADTKPFKVKENQGGGAWTTPSNLLEDIGPVGRLAIAEALLMYSAELVQKDISLTTIPLAT